MKFFATIAFASSASAFQGSFAPKMGAQRTVSNMKMFDLDANNIGVTPPLGVFDPLGLIETRDMRRYEIMEIKHGRAAMLGFLGVITTESGLRFPGYLSPSADLKFSDMPGGALAS
jgi:light-harvesting complex I chlorophyll a/b binding protein 1